MSRIHDALRRGRGPAGMPAARRTAQADAVLVALGYKSDRRRIARVALPITAVIVCGGLLGAWFLSPSSGLLSSSRTPVPAPTVSPPASRPAVLDSRTQTGNPPAASVSAKQPESNPPASATAPAPTPAPAARPTGETPAVAFAPTPGSGLRAVKSARATSAAATRPEVSGPRESALPPPLPNAAPAAPKAVPAAPDEFQLALYYQRSGDFEQALVHYRAALQRDEMNVQARNNLGNLYLGKGLFEEAAREFQRVLAIDPKYLNAHVNLSAAYTRLGRPDAAAAEARAALQIDGRNPDAMVNLSLAQHDAGQTADAQRSLRRALEIDPHNAAAHYNMARQFEAAGELPSAIAHYNQFIQYASPEQTGFAADVRARVTALSTRLK